MAALLDDVAARCAPLVPRSANQAKDLAARLGGGLPLIWGFSPLPGLVATRLANQIAENAALPALASSSSEGQHNQIVALAGDYGSRAVPGAPRLHLVMVRDPADPVRAGHRAELSVELAAEAGVPASSLRGSLGIESPELDRAAELIALADFASVYLALLCGVDPTPVVPITDLKARMAGAGVPGPGKSGRSDITD